jgi:hypothetical protein
MAVNATAHPSAFLKVFFSFISFLFIFQQLLYQQSINQQSFVPLHLHRHFILIQEP